MTCPHVLSMPSSTETCIISICITTSYVFVACCEAARTARSLMFMYTREIQQI